VVRRDAADIADVESHAVEVRGAAEEPAASALAWQIASAPDRPPRLPA
jgi:hypothetical protein